MNNSNQYQDFYYPYYEIMQATLTEVLNFFKKLKLQNDKIYEYCINRIKAPESMQKKLTDKGFTVNSFNALTAVTDSIGIRIICSFLHDVYTIADQIEKHSEWQILKTKDFITRPKANGYRSYHLVISVPTDIMRIPIEIQIRTISQDSWANLEHQMKYKKEISNRELIQKELKRCADEFASTDISMQTIKELIMEFDSE